MKALKMPDMTFETIQKTLDLIKNDLPLEANLIAVSKQQPIDRIHAALSHGHRCFGENRIQEAITRWQPIRENYKDLELHLIGPLQSNKATDAIALFDVIHSVDRLKIADSLANEMQKQNRHLPCFLQVNTGNESQKSGISVHELETLYKHATEAAGLNIIGLMCIPPQNEAPSLHFTLLKKYADDLGLKRLSMGMSQDYKIALQCGATDIRIGSGLFGTRG